MEDDLKVLGKWKKTSTFYANGRQPQCFRQMKMTSTFYANVRRPQRFRQMETDFNFLAKWKTTSTVASTT